MMPHIMVDREYQRGLTVDDLPFDSQLDHRMAQGILEGAARDAVDEAQSELDASEKTIVAFIKNGVARKDTDRTQRARSSLTSAQEDLRAAQEIAGLLLIPPNVPHGPEINISGKLPRGTHLPDGSTLPYTAAVTLQAQPTSSISPAERRSLSGDSGMSYSAVIGGQEMTTDVAAGLVKRYMPALQAREAIKRSTIVAGTHG